LERTQTLYDALDQQLFIEQEPVSEEPLEVIIDRGPVELPARLQWFQQAKAIPDQSTQDVNDAAVSPIPLVDLAPGTVWTELARMDEFEAQSSIVQTFETLLELPPYSDWALETDLPSYRFITEYPAIEEAIRLYGWSVREAEMSSLDAIASSRIDLLASGLAAIDTGIHMEQWTLSDASQYLEDIVGVRADLAQRLVLMVVARPGYHSAVQTTLSRISAISERAQAVLGDRYDEREFLRAIFSPGPRPLPLIETDVENWYAARLEN